MTGELPLRILEQHGGYVIRCLCGAEAALVRPAVDAAAPIVRAARGQAVVNRGLGPDMTPAAVVRMALHAKACTRARELEARRAQSARNP